MKYIILFLSFVFSVTVFCKGDSWYKYFEGKIGEYPVIVHLHKFGDRLEGFYYYERFRMPINMTGSVNGDSLSILAYTNYDNSEDFKGVFKKGIYSGTWEQYNKNLKLSFSLKENTEMSSRFEFVYVTGEEPLIKKMKDKSPYVSYLEGCIWPTQEFDDYRYMRNAICKEKNYPKNITAIGGEMLVRKRKYIAGYKEENKELTEKDLEDIGFSTSYDLVEEDVMQIAYYDKNIFVLSWFGYSYTGGAHGNYGTSYIVYDLKNRRKIRLSEVVSSEGITALPQILEKNFRKQNNVPENQSLSEFGLFGDTITVTENFLLTPGCLMFDYMPYEIGPYAAGEIQIYIPIEDLEHYLTTEIKKLLL